MAQRYGWSLDNVFGRLLTVVTVTIVTVIVAMATVGVVEANYRISSTRIAKAALARLPGAPNIAQGVNAYVYYLTRNDFPATAAQINRARKQAK